MTPPGWPPTPFSQGNTPRCLWRQGCLKPYSMADRANMHQVGKDAEPAKFTQSPSRVKTGGNFGISRIPYTTDALKIRTKNVNKAKKIRENTFRAESKRTFIAWMMDFNYAFVPLICQFDGIFSIFFRLSMKDLLIFRTFESHFRRFRRKKLRFPCFYRITSLSIFWQIDGDFT